jgi:hypothetical protein
MTKKILITGFPHCGTTLLRALVGNCKNVFDQNNEFPDVTSYRTNMPFDFYVWKHPFLHREFRDYGFKHKPNTPYKDVIVIPIIRNPWNVFTSLHKRGSKYGEFSILDDKQGHSIPYYENTAHRIYEVIQNPVEDVYPIRYEDIFANNFEKLKNIFDSIGLEYDETTFDNSEKKFKHNNITFKDGYDGTLEENINDRQYRIWQINQPIQNMNSDIDIPQEIDDRLQQSQIVNKLGYSN